MRALYRESSLVPALGDGGATSWEEPESLGDRMELGLLFPNNLYEAVTSKREAVTVLSL